MTWTSIRTCAHTRDNISRRRRPASQHLAKRYEFGMRRRYCIAVPVMVHRLPLLLVSKLNIFRLRSPVGRISDGDGNDNDEGTMRSNGARRK